MPRPSRICSVLDCGRAHYAAGLCEKHYRAERRKAPVSHVLGPEDSSPENREAS